MIESIGETEFIGEMDDVIKEIVPFIENGFYVKKIESYLSYVGFPSFYKRMYCVTLEVHIIYDGNTNVTVPSTEQLIKELQ